MSKYNLEDLKSKDRSVRYPAAKKIMELAREKPEALYPDIEFFVGLLEGKDSIILWNAVRTIGSLARVDTDKKIDNILHKLYGLLDSGNMVTAGNTISALSDIALARPEHRQEITRELLKVEHYKYKTEECGRIVVGGAIEAIGAYFDRSEKNDSVIAFVKRHTASTRKSTAKKAEVFLKKHMPEENGVPEISKP